MATRNYMNIIDISHWQNGINLATLFQKNADLDGVIVKATGGVGYVDPNCDGWVQWLKANGKPWGFYHFLDDDFRNSSGTREADFFVSQTKNYFKHGIPFADYEYPATYKGTAYLKEFLDRVYALTGVKCGVYCSLSIVQSQDFTAIHEAGYPLWMAQYPDYNPTGFQPNPWQRGSYAPYTQLMMQQYTSSGYIAGYGKRLDLNKFFGTISDWNRYAQAEEQPTDLKPADPQIVMRVLKNEFGTNSNGRPDKLRAIGYDPTLVQAKVDELYNIADNFKKTLGANKDYAACIGKILGG